MAPEVAVTLSSAARYALPRVYVSRPRLLRRLEECVQGKLVILRANAGYGKTSLLVEFLQSGGLPVVWHRFTSADRDVVRIADGLEVCLRQLAGLEPRTTKRQILERRTEPSAAVLCQALLGHAAMIRSKDSLLVLDDYQNVDEHSDADWLLGRLIESSPPCLHFVVLSRIVPRLPLARLKVRHEVAVIGESELAFTAEETARFLRDESGLQLSDADVAWVHSRTEGWAAALSLVSQSLQHGSQERVMSLLRDPAASAWLVYDYLAQEVFDREEPDIQQFLVKTSVLSTMSAEACDYLLDSGSSRRILLALEDRGLFTMAVDPSRQLFRYHQLFVAFLREKLQEMSLHSAVQALHARAGQYYQHRERWEDSVRHWLRAGDAMKAAQIVEEVGERYILSGFSHTVERWLRDLPDDLTSTRPWLIALRGRLSSMSVRIDEASRLLERALWLFRQSGDHEGQAWVAGEMGIITNRARLLQQSIRYFDSALPMARSGTIHRNRILAGKAIALREAGMIREALEACRTALAEAAAIDNEVDRLWCQSRAARILAHTQLEAGDLEVALPAAQDVLDFCVANHIGEYEESWALANLGGALWASGHLEKAIAVLNRALSLSGRYVRQLRNFIGVRLGNSLRDSGRFVEADEIYTDSGWDAEMERVYLALVAGRGHSAGRAALDLYRAHRTSEDMEDRGTAEVVISAVLRENRELDRALEHIRQAVSIWGEHGYQIRLFSALLHQARLEYELARPSQGRATLARAFELAADRHYFHCYWWDPALVAGLCYHALADGVFVEYAAELVERRLRGFAVESLAPLLQHRRADVRRRVSDLLSSIPHQRVSDSPGGLLGECTDSRVRASLLRAVKEGLVTPSGVQMLRSKKGLSWREIEVLVEYYLRRASLSVSEADHLRRDFAQQLGISENTLRCHVNNLRSKLQLPKWVSGKLVLDWAREQDLLPPFRSTGAENTPSKPSE